MVAQRNVARYKSPTQACTRIDCLWLDATLYEVPLGPKVCFFFNPFHEPVMTQVVRRLEASLIAGPSPTFISTTVRFCNTSSGTANAFASCE